MNGFLDDFDETIHAPRRLAICAILASVDAAEFSTIRDSLGISDSSLSKQVSMLSDAGYVSSEKVAGVGRPRTWVRLTVGGNLAFHAHVEKLRSVLQSTDARADPSDF